MSQHPNVPNGSVRMTEMNGKENLTWDKPKNKCICTIFLVFVTLVCEYLVRPTSNLKLTWQAIGSKETRTSPISSHFIVENDKMLWFLVALFMSNRMYGEGLQEGTIDCMYSLLLTTKFQRIPLCIWSSTWKISSSIISCWIFWFPSPPPM